MGELKEWQREVGKVSLRDGERAFVLGDGRVIASNTNDPDFKEYSQERAKEKTQKRKDALNAKLEKAKERLGKQAKKRALKEMKAQSKIDKAKEELEALKEEE